MEPNETMGNNSSNKIYLDPSNPWSFEGHKKSAIYGYNGKDESSDQCLIYEHKYGAKKGNHDFPDGYVIVWGAKQQPFNGIYHSGATYGGHIYRGPYMKTYDDNFAIINKDSADDNTTQHFLKFSRLKGIKIVPAISSYSPYDQAAFWWGNNQGNRWKQSPKNDEDIANFRWDLIENTKKRLSNGESVKFASQKSKTKLSEKGSEELQKHYNTLMAIKSFNYKYIYKYDNKLKKLVSEDNDFANYAFIRNFAFDKHFYPELAKCIPETYDYKRKREMKHKLLILTEYFNEISHLVDIVFTYLDLDDTCIHKYITHIICMTEGKNSLYYTQKFVCDECERSISMPKNDVNEQLWFISRVRRSFGVEKNGRKSGHTPHLHSFKIRKWISDERFNGMTHENVSGKTINVYKTDEISEMNNANQIGTILKGERVYVYWESRIGMLKHMMAIRTKDGIVGYCMVDRSDRYEPSSDLLKLKVPFSEIEKFVIDNNIIVSRVRVYDGKNPIGRLRYTLRGLYSE